MVDAGYLAEGDEPNSEQYANYLVRLNDLINFWQTQGLKLWVQEDLAVPLTVGQGTYNLGPGGSIDMTKPMRVLQAYYLDSNDVKRPLIALSRDEYTRLSNVTQTGAVNSYFIDKQRTQLAVNLWLVPDTTAATGTVQLVIQSQVPNLISLTDDLTFPQEWFLALRWGLADDICTGQPQAIMERCMTKAMVYMMALEAWDVEDASTSFAPDQRSAYIVGGFR